MCGLFQNKGEQTDPSKLTQAAQAIKQAADKAGQVAQAIQEAATEPVGQKPEPIHRKVLLVIYNPPIKSEGGKRLIEVMKWNDPDDLTAKYIADVRDCSYGYANYQVVERLEVDYLPAKEDGFSYTPDEYVKCLRQNSGFHQPDAVDYKKIVADCDIVEKVKSGAIHEAWLFAGPYAGFYESIMGGPGAFWCNAPPYSGGEAAGSRFIIMGFNYQRGVGEMLEDLGHRAESIMKHVYRFTTGELNLWERFARYDKTHPGQAEVGMMHFAPNSLKDYDWGNKKKVKSRHHVWKNFPNLDGDPREVDTAEWGGGDIRAHHLWWFKHVPHVTGSAAGIFSNWWRYIVDPNQVII